MVVYCKIGDMKKLSAWQKGALALALVFTFLLVFSPHLSYHLPFHVDEWHHISESIRLGNYGEYIEAFRTGAERGFSGLEIGFHFFLFLLSFAIDLVTIYQLLPALWATLAAGIIFFIVYKKTDENYWAGLGAVLFFASIKSNVNLTGLWFFTPLTFSIPLIYLYMYLFNEALEKENRKYLLASFSIMTVLLFTHSISVLFAVPALLIVMALHYRYVLKEYKIFLGMFLIAIAGLA